MISARRECEAWRTNTRSLPGENLTDAKHPPNALQRVWQVITGKLGHPACEQNWVRGILVSLDYIPRHFLKLGSRYTTLDKWESLGPGFKCGPCVRWLHRWNGFLNVSKGPKWQKTINKNMIQPENCRFGGCKCLVLPRSTSNMHVSFPSFEFTGWNTTGQKKGIVYQRNTSWTLWYSPIPHTFYLSDMVQLVLMHVSDTFYFSHRFNLSSSHTIVICH